MNKKLLLIGGGGHCKSVLDSLRDNESYDGFGIIDKKENIGKSILGVPIIGCDDDLFGWFHRGYTDAFITLGSIGSPTLRVVLFAELERIGFEIPNIVDPTSIISRYITLGKGIYIGKNVVVNVGTFIGKGAIINTGSLIEHDCSIGEFAHIAPGAVLCGEVKIGSYTHVGANSVVKQQIEIGSNTLIGIGSVVVFNIIENVVAFGNPCKEVSTQ